MSNHTITFPEEGTALGNWPPSAAIRKVLELVAVQEENAPAEENFDEGAQHTITFLTSMDPEVCALRLNAQYMLYHKNMHTQHVVAKWCNAGFVQYLLWDSTKQDIVDMVEA